MSIHAPWGVTFLAVGGVAILAVAVLAAAGATPAQRLVDPATPEQIRDARASGDCADAAIQRQAAAYPASPLAVGTVNNIVTSCRERAAQAGALR